MTIETPRGETVDPHGLTVDATRKIGRAQLTLLRLS
jgi:hypothetical protein